MKALYMIISIFIIIVFQIGIVEAYVNTDFLVNLPLIAIIFYNWQKPKLESLLFTFFLALGISYFDGLMFGVSIFIMIIIGALIQYISIRFLTNNALSSLLFSGLIGVITYYGLVAGFSTTQFGVDFDLLISYFFATKAIIFNLLITLSLLSLIKLFLKKHEILEKKY